MWRCWNKFSNDGDETFSVGASGDSTVDSYGRQEIFVNNGCNGDATTCGGNTDNILTISATDTSVDSNCKQESNLNNDCNGGV